MSEILLEVKDLKVHYPLKKRLGLPLQVNRAVDGISFSVKKGETFGIVGESGCGKSTTGFAIVRLLKPIGGEILFKSRNILSYPREEDMELTRNIQIIFQDPYSSLDPRFTIGRSISEPMLIHKMGNSAQCKKRSLELMDNVGLTKEQYTKYPHEFSGGQRQRVGIARALALNPQLIICDEPVSALDVSIQGQILNLLKDLQKEFQLTYVFISHDLSVVNQVCDRVAVMYLGNIMEIGTRKDLFERPLHPYTQALLRAIPIPDPKIPSMEGILEGDIPSPTSPPSGCSFHTRCPKAIDKCRLEKPIFQEVRAGQLVACHLV